MSLQSKCLIIFWVFFEFEDFCVAALAESNGGDKCKPECHASVSNVRNEFDGKLQNCIIKEVIFDCHSSGIRGKQVDANVSILRSKSDSDFKIQLLKSSSSSSSYYHHERYTEYEMVLDSRQDGVATTCIIFAVPENQLKDLEELQLTCMGLSEAHYLNSRISIYELRSTSNHKKKRDLSILLDYYEEESNEDLVLQADQPCSCKNCLNVKQEIIESESILKLSFDLENDSICCVPCKNFSLFLFSISTSSKKDGITDRDFCENLDSRSPLVLRQLNLVTKTLRMSQREVKYELPTACYIVRLQTQMSIPFYLGFHWLESSLPNMKTWNTTVFVQSSTPGYLEVRWKVPDYPFNFSSFDVLVFYAQNSNVSCFENGNLQIPVKILESKNVNASSPVAKFENIEEGYYCSRLIPVDSRCIAGGCQPRASPTYLIKGVQGQEMVSEVAGENFSAVPYVIGGAALGIVIILATFLMKITLQFRKKEYYGHISVYKERSLLSEKIQVLLVWTKIGSPACETENVINVLKHLLMTYGSCTVIDYMDVLSMNSTDREHLLCDPTAWIDTILLRKDVKIIIVNNEGTSHSQFSLEKSQPKGTNDHTVSFQQEQSFDPLDSVLYPYVLNQIRNLPHLAYDYSRLFHVSFSSNGKSQFNSLVSATCYSLPHHFAELIFALHGAKSPSLEELPEMCQHTMTSLESAISLYRKAIFKRTEGRNQGDPNDLSNQDISSKWSLLRSSPETVIS